MDDSFIELTLIRHGATDANKENRYLGRTEESLSQEGVHEILSLWKDGITADILFYSPMKRCMETANLIFHLQKISGKLEDYPRISVPEWREMDFGDFEMKNYRELNGNPAYQAWIDSGGTLAFPGGESQDRLICRVMSGFENTFLPEVRKIWKNPAKEKRGMNTIYASAVVHGGTIMALMHGLTGQPYFDFQVKNGHGYKVLLTLDGEFISKKKF